MNLKLVMIDTFTYLNIQCVFCDSERVEFESTNFLIQFYSFTGYSTNSLSSVSVGKSTLEPHTHFRQPGE